ncbi:TIGR04222 domain-containing membrane protein [Amycolatopsis magusensis]|uniref:TIGR04222 domain-containing membrane protein n=1 Tax=Amycolatopsis magusensis TaxID=882444 RepID=UPI0024A856D6|nr:TIGR04222 domain-containing membrane protein [Amycolatopsis magusensis]MDI5981360.1 TIGR04222 domain-containing membrane protein [Amycolatopsis magusensis]
MMEEPWGISGPMFIGLYVCLLIAPLVVAVLGRMALAAAGSRSADSYRPGNVYEVAYLAGGADRVTETAVASLLERGTFRADSTGQVHGAGAVPDDAVERAVHHIVQRRGSVKMPGLRKEMRSADVIRGMEQHLARAGLIRPVRGRARLRRLVHLLYLAVLAVGVARLVNGISLDRPVGVLIFLVILAAVATLIATAVARSTPRGRPTAQGSVQLASARNWQSRQQAATAGGAPPRSSSALPMLAGAAGAVAIGGMMMYPDEEMRTALAAPSSGGASGGDGGGGSCGGGGGGCGGCGGCGG